MRKQPHTLQFLLITVYWMHRLLCRCFLTGSLSFAEVMLRVRSELVQNCTTLYRSFLSREPTPPGAVKQPRSTRPVAEMGSQLY